MLPYVVTAQSHQVLNVQAKLSKSQKGIQLWKEEKSEWEKKEAEYQV